MKTFFLMLIVFFAASFDDPHLDSSKSRLENLKGTFADPMAVDWGRGTFGKRVFTFENGNWTLNFTLSFDPDQEQKIFTFRTVGTYEVLNKSKVVKGAYDAVFYEDKKLVTLHTDNPEIVQGFGFAPCNLKVNQEKDISISGCSLWKPVSECNEDHDLLKLDKDGNLYFGQRPQDNDMCSADKRPTALTPAVVKL